MYPRYILYQSRLQASNQVVVLGGGFSLRLLRVQASCQVLLKEWNVLYGIIYVMARNY